jgi:hypothetical protein
MADPKNPTAFARHIARTKRLRLKRYHIGSSFRESSAGGQPHAFGEIGPFRVPLPRIIAQSLNTLPLQPTISSRPCDPWPQRPSSSLCSTGSSTRSPVSLSASGSSTSRTLPVCGAPPPSLRLPPLTEADFAGLLPPTVLELLLERIPSSRRTDVCDILREIGGKTTFPHVRGKLGLARSALDYLEKWAVAGAFALQAPRPCVTDSKRCSRLLQTLSSRSSTCSAIASRRSPPVCARPRARWPRSSAWPPGLASGARSSSSRRSRTASSGRACSSNASASRRSARSLPSAVGQSPPGSRSCSSGPSL